MSNPPCTECGYVIHHDEECPGCAREYMDAQLVEVQAKLDALRTAAERYWRGECTPLDFFAAIEASR